MELKFSEKGIAFEKKLNDLDKLVFKFVKVLEECKIDYVIISGYAAILFGRSRNTETVDLFIEEMPFEKSWIFGMPWKKRVLNALSQATRKKHLTII